MIGLSLGAAKPNALRQPNRPAQEVILVTAAEGKIASATGNRSLTITLATPHPLAGSYRIKAESLAAGPLCLVPPTIIGDGSGKVLRVQPGLWACSPVLGAPEFTLSWMAGEVILAGEADSTLVLTQDLGGQAVRHAETLRQGTLKGASISAPVQITGIQPEPEPRLAVTPEPDATLTATVQDGEVTITVTAPPEHAGSYTVQTAELAAGPVWLKQPVLAYPNGLGVGRTITATPGLVVNNADHGAIVVTGGWHRGDTPISGTTGLTHIITQADQGHDLSYRQIATNGAGSRTTQSLPVSISLPGSLPDTFTAPNLTRLKNYIGESEIPWDATVDHANIEDGFVRPAASNNDFFQSRLDVLGADQFAEGYMVLGAGGAYHGFECIGLALRVNGAEGYFVRHVTDGWQVGLKATAGNASLVSGMRKNLDPSGSRVKVRFEIQGTTLRLFLNDALVWTGTDGVLTAGRAGLFVRGGAHMRSGAKLDTFHAGNL